MYTENLLFSPVYHSPFGIAIYGHDVAYARTKNPVFVFRSKDKKDVSVCLTIEIRDYTKSQNGGRSDVLVIVSDNKHESFTSLDDCFLWLEKQLPLWEPKKTRIYEG